MMVHGESGGISWTANANGVSNANDVLKSKVYSCFISHWWGSTPCRTHDSSACEPYETYSTCNPTLWDVSRVTDMEGLFYQNGQGFFGDANINRHLDLTNWDVSSVTNMRRMFYQIRTANINISTWDVSNVESMEEMFSGFDYYGMMRGNYFNQPINSWNVSKVTNMRRMFYRATQFNQSLDNWDVSSVTTMEEMFDYAEAFDQQLRCWNLESMNDSQCIFRMLRYTPAQYKIHPIARNCPEVNTEGVCLQSITGGGRPLSTTCNMHSTVKMSRYGACSCDSNKGLTNVINGVGDCESCPAGEDSTADQKTCQACNGTYRTSEMAQCVTNTDYDREINDDKTGTQVCVPGQDSSASNGATCAPCADGTYRTSEMAQCVTNTNYSKGIRDDKTGTEECASGKTSLYNNGVKCCLKYHIWNGTNCVDKTSHVYQFSATSPISLGSRINSCGSTDWAGDGCDTRLWDVSQITDMSELFKNNVFNQPLNTWNVSSVTNMKEMFKDAVNFNQPLDNWDVSKVTDMKEMFKDAVNFNQPLDNWDVSKVTDMNQMFKDAVNFNQPLDTWDVSSVTTMSQMFKDAEAFDQQLRCWNMSEVTDIFRMLQDSRAQYKIHPVAQICTYTDPSDICVEYGQYVSMLPKSGYHSSVKMSKYMKCCPAGQDSFASNGATCAPCADGTYRSSEMVRCLPNTDYNKGILADKTGTYYCEPGEDSSASNGTTCPCPSGTYRTSEMEQCVSNTNYDSEINDDKNGTQGCVPGQDSFASNGATCAPCTSGTYRNASMEQCTVCEGKTSPEGSTVCYTYAQIVNSLTDQQIIDEWNSRHGTCGSS